MATLCNYAEAIGCNLEIKRVPRQQESIPHDSGCDRAALHIWGGDRPSIFEEGDHPQRFAVSVSANLEEALKLLAESMCSLTVKSLAIPLSLDLVHTPHKSPLGQHAA